MKVKNLLWGVAAFAAIGWWRSRRFAGRQETIIRAGTKSSKGMQPRIAPHRPTCNPNDAAYCLLELHTAWRDLRGV